MVFLGVFLILVYTFYFFYFYIIYFYIITFIFFFTCDSAFEQGHLEPWRYINAFIIISIAIIIIIIIIAIDEVTKCDLMII